MANKGNLGTRERQEKWRDSIQTSKILKRVENQSLGKDTFSGKTKIREMTNVDIRCAELLLARTFPAIKLVEQTGAGGGPLHVSVIQFSDADSNDTK